MENKIFQSKAVAKLMKAHLVEARLHTDTQSSLTKEQFEENRDYQDRIGGSKANPYFAIVDPNTGNIIEEFSLSGAWTTWEGKWMDFIKRCAKKAGRPVN